MTLDEIRHRATVTVEEAANLLGIGIQTAYLAARRGELPGCFRVGRRWIVGVPALLRALEGDSGMSGHDR